MITEQQTELRKQRLIEHILNTDDSITKAAEAIGIDRHVASRYWYEWTQTEQYAYLQRRFWNAINYAHLTDPMKEAELLTRVFAKTIREPEHRVEQESALPDQIVFDLVGPQEGKKEESQVVRQEGKPSSVKPVPMEQ